MANILVALMFFGFILMVANMSPPKLTENVQDPKAKANDVQYKLYYFYTRGRAEPIRLLLHYVGQKYEDVRYGSMEEFREKHQSKFFYGRLPVLEVDGKQLGQSGAILRYLGEKFDLAGKDEWEKAKVNEIIDFNKDAYDELSPYLYVRIGYFAGDLDKLRAEVLEPGAKRIFPLYEQLLKQSGSGFLLPSGLTMVDFLVGDFLYNFTRLEPLIIGEYPDLVEYVQRVHKLPELRKYLDTRKD